MIGTGDQRNGTVYLDGTGDDVTIKNSGDHRRRQGATSATASPCKWVPSSEDAVNENINIVNSGDIQGRGQAAFAEGGRVWPPTAPAACGSSTDRATPEATVTGSDRQLRRPSTAEVDAGFLGGVVVEDGVAFDGTIVNERMAASISGPRNGLYIGNADHDLTIQNHGLIDLRQPGSQSRWRQCHLRPTPDDVIGTGDQRNGTVYLDGTADDVDGQEHRRH